MSGQLLTVNVRRFLFFVVGGCSIVAMLLVDEPVKDSGAHIGWSFGMEVISFIFVIATISLISLDRCRHRKAGKSMRKSIDLSLIHTTSNSSFNSFTNTNTVVDLKIDEREF